jgi:hypothetical protein
VWQVVKQHCLCFTRPPAGAERSSRAQKVTVKHYDQASEAFLRQLVKQHCLGLTGPPAAEKKAAAWVLHNSYVE